MSDLTPRSVPTSTRYACQCCTACCRWPGDVKLTDEEVVAIADFLNLSLDAFVENYTRLRVNRQGLSLTEKPDSDDCICLTEEGLCLINPVKPQQCRDFPHRWNFPGWQNLCKAIPIKDE